MHLFLCGCELKDDDAIVGCCYAVEECSYTADEIVLGFSRQSDSDALRAVLVSDLKIDGCVNKYCASTDDWFVFSVLYSMGRNNVISGLTIFDGEMSTRFEKEFERVRGLRAQLSNLSSALKLGQIDRAEVFILLARKELLEFNGAYVSMVYERLGALAALIEICRARYQAPLPSGSSGLIYSRKDPIECWVDFFATIDPDKVALIQAWPEVADDQKRIRDFYSDGKFALSNDLASLKSGGKLPLITMLWLAAYFVRKCEYYISLKDGASAIALVVRALEAYLYFRLYEIGLMEFDRQSRRIIPSSSARQKFERAGDGVKGCLLALVAERQFSGIDFSQAEIVIHLRNRSAITHGVQRLDCASVRAALTHVKSFINDVEKNTPHVGNRWENLVAGSFMIDWVAAWGRAFSSLLTST